jgi:hypothetical protein
MSVRLEILIRWRVQPTGSDHALDIHQNRNNRHGTRTVWCKVIEEYSNSNCYSIAESNSYADSKVQKLMLWTRLEDGNFVGKDSELTQKFKLLN